MANAHMPDEFFDIVAHHLPPEQPVGPKGGRPRVGHRVVIRVIWFVLATGSRWEDVPPELGCSGRTAHRRLRAWEEAGIWDRLHADLLRLLQAGRQARPRHGDRRRRHRAGLRRRRGDRPQPRGPPEEPARSTPLMVDRHGVPLAIRTAGANASDHTPDHPGGARLPQGRRASRAGPRSCPTSCTPTGATTARRRGRCCGGWGSSRTSPSGGRRTAAGWGRSAGWWSGPSAGSRGCGGCGSGTTGSA